MWTALFDGAISIIPFVGSLEENEGKRARRELGAAVLRLGKAPALLLPLKL